MQTHVSTYLNFAALVLGWEIKPNIKRGGMMSRSPLAIASGHRLRHCRNAAVMSSYLHPPPYFLIWASTGDSPISTLAGGRVLDRVFLGSKGTQSDTRNLAIVLLCIGVG